MSKNIEIKDENPVLRGIIQPLNKKIIGQERAIAALGSAIQKSLVGFKNPNRPLGVFMFAGPSRVGKTETARALAEQLKMFRFKKFMQAAEKQSKCLELSEEQKIIIKGKLDNINAALSSISSMNDIFREFFDKKKNSEANLIIQNAISSISSNEINVDLKSIYEIFKSFYCKRIESVEDDEKIEDFETVYPSLVRIDCETLKEKFSATSLTSSPPGYIGSDRPGLLVPEVINGNWGLVVLFDEIEKAHPNVCDILLQIFDYGKLKLANARGEIDFSKSIIIMTSNIGSGEIEKHILGREMGFRVGGDSARLNDQKSDTVYKICKEALASHFSREFRNRIDSVIAFRCLGKDSLRKILDLEISKLYDRVLKCGTVFSVAVSDKVKDYIVGECHYEEQAAGIIHLVERKIVGPISSFLVQQEIKTGDEVAVYLTKKNEIKFRVRKSAKLKEKEIIEMVEEGGESAVED